MKKIVVIVLALIITNTVLGQVQNKAYDEMLQNLLSHTVTEVHANEINDTDTSIVYLDTREKKEYEISHIKNAVWAGFLSFKMKRINHIPKDKKIIVYCSVGYRSEKISERLVKAGYTNVSNLYGGIFEMVNQDHPVYDINESKTEKVHPYDRNWGVWLTKGIKAYK